jgi:hypothetical protein
MEAPTTFPYAPPTTTPPYQTPAGGNTISNYTINIPSFDCSNLSGKLLSGDVTHEALCAIIIPLGVSWTFGLATIFIGATFYLITGIYGASIISLIFISLFYNYLPQPIRVFLGLVIALAMATILLRVFRVSHGRDSGGLK